MPGPGTKFESYPIFFNLLKQSKKPLWSLSIKKKKSFIHYRNRRTLRVAMEIEKKKMFHHQGSLTSRVASQSGLRQLKKKKIQIKKKKESLTIIASSSSSLRSIR